MDNYFYVLVNQITGKRLLLNSKDKREARKEAYARSLKEGWYKTVMHTYKDSSLNLLHVAIIAK